MLADGAEKVVKTLFAVCLAALLVLLQLIHFCQRRRIRDEFIARYRKNKKMGIDEKNQREAQIRELYRKQAVNAKKRGKELSDLTNVSNEGYKFVKESFVELEVTLAVIRFTHTPEFLHKNELFLLSAALARIQQIVFPILHTRGALHLSKIGTQFVAVFAVRDQALKAALEIQQ